MPTQARMKRQIDSTTDLQSVVRTMKALAAVSIRQYEKAARSLDEYNRTLELGLGIVLQRAGAPPAAERPAGQRIAVVVGSDQGMCGKFNEDIARLADEQLQQQDDAGHWEVITIGERTAGLVKHSGLSLRQGFPAPGSVSAITARVQDLLAVLGGIEGLSALVVLHNRHTSGASYEPTTARLLPLDHQWLDTFQSRPWPTNQLPAFTMDANRLFAFLVREYLFVSLYRALAHSLAGENASRLAAMQSAESNIEERLGELTTAYHHERQSAITSELLDIVSGFEALQ